MIEVGKTPCAYCAEVATCLVEDIPVCAEHTEQATQDLIQKHASADYTTGNQRPFKTAYFPLGG